MATRTISTRLAIEGESEYKRKVAEVNQSLKTMGSELGLVEAKFKEQANTREALLAKSTALSRSYDLQAEKVRLTKAALDEAKAAQDKYAASAAEMAQKIAQSEAKLAALQKSTKGSAAEQKALTEEIAKYKKTQEDAQRYQDAAARGVEQWTQKNNAAERELIELGRQVSSTSGYLAEATVSADGCAKSIDRYGREAKQAGKHSDEFGDKSAGAVEALASALAAAGVAKGIKEIAAALWQCLEAGMSFESAFTGVLKTVEGSPEQLAAVREGIKQLALDIPATVEEISAVAESAGQLGVATDDVLSFTRTMIDLGQSTNLSAEEAASSLAKFANITGMAAENYGRLGSVVVGLGNNYATTEADIVAMSTRLAASGKLAGLTEPQIMALATSMSSVGIEAEAGGTAMTQTLTSIEKAVSKGGKDLSEFARISGMSAEKFAQMWKADAMSAIQAFIGGLGALDAQGESATLVLDELGLSGVRQSNMLKSMALAADSMTGAVALANTAWAENTALTEEAAKRYDTTESKLAMLNNAFVGVKAAIGDALDPALREAAESGTDAFAWATDFIEENPWLVQAITGATVGLGVLAAGVAGYTVVTSVSTAVTTAFSAALKACPAIFVASAIIGLVTAVGMFAAGAKEAAKKADGLSESVRESKKAFEEAAGAAEEQKDNALELVAALKDAMETEERSAAQKATVLSLVERLNEAVPGLALAYDQERDSLNLTTEAIERMALAQAKDAENAAAQEYLAGLYVSRQKASTDLADAQERLRQAEENLVVATEKATAAGYDEEYQMYAAEVATDNCRKEVEKLTRQQATTEEQIIVTAEAYNDLTAATEEQTTADKSAEEQSAQTAKLLEEQKKAAKELSDASLDLTGAQDDLTAALKEQKEEGGLSLERTLRLIDAGYAAALSTDAETGAVTLNKDAYIAVARAKMEEQIAAIEAQKASVDAAIQLGKEAYQATETAVGYLELAKARRAAKAEASDADLNALKSQSAAYDAQISALNRAKGAIGSYSQAASTAYSRTTSSAKKAKTQAEVNLEAYKAQKAALDHDKAMDLLSEEDYYKQLQSIGARYLSDSTNLDALRKNHEEVYQGKQTAAKAEEKLMEEHLAREEDLYRNQMEAYAKAQVAAIDEIEGAYNTAIKKRDDMAGKLSDYGELFTVKDNRMSLSNIQEQIDAIDRYGETITGLRDRGISGELLNEIVGMGVDEASDYGQKLLGMSDKDWEEYTLLWEEKNRRAVEVSELFYKDQLGTLKNQHEEKLQGALDGMSGITFDVGAEMGSSLTSGIESKREEAMAAARTLAEDIEATIRKAWDMHSPSRKMIDMGETATVSVAMGIESKRMEAVSAAERMAQEVEAVIVRSIPANPEPQNREAATRAATSNAVAEGVANALAAVAPLLESRGDTPRIEVPVYLNEKEIARAVYDPLDDERRRRGE